MELKKGQKLYNISYYGHKRELEHIVIKKVNKKTIKAAWYDNLFIKKEKIGVDIFISKKEAIKNAIKLHKEYLRHNKDDVIAKDQIVSLEKWLKRLNKCQKK